MSGGGAGVQAREQAFSVIERMIGDLREKAANHLKTTRDLRARLIGIPPVVESNANPPLGAPVGGIAGEMVRNLSSANALLIEAMIDIDAMLGEIPARPKDPSAKEDRIR